MKVEQVDHIHIAVKDLDTSVDFFENFLGIKFSKEIIIDEFEARSKIAPIGPVGIELVEPTSSDSVFAKFIERKGEGLNAISLKVPNLDEAVTEMEARGLQPIYRTKYHNMTEVGFHPKSAYGVMIELCEYETIHGAVFACLGTKTWKGGQDE